MRFRARRSVQITLAALACTVVAGWLIIQSPAVQRPLRAWAYARIAELFGPGATVEGVQVALAHGAVEIEHVEIPGTPPGAARLSVGIIRIQWDWMRLLFGKLEPHTIVLVQPVLSLTAAWTDAAGLFPRAAGGRGTGGPHPAFVQRLQIIEGTVRHASGLAVAHLTGTLNWDAEGQPALALRAGAVSLDLVGTRRELRDVTVSGSLSEGTLAITDLKGSAGAMRLSGSGRVRSLWTAPDLDLQVAATAPLTDIAQGHALAASGRVTGAWPRPAFAGDVRLVSGASADQTYVVPVVASWQDGRFAIEAAGSTGGVSGHGAWTPATGQYQGQLRLQDLDLARVAGSQLLARATGWSLPPAAGRLFGETVLSGEGSDLASLRGRFTIRIENLRSGMLSGSRFEGRGLASASGIVFDAFRVDMPGGTLQGRGTVSRQATLDLVLRADLPDVAAFTQALALPTASGTATLQGRVGGDWQVPRWQGRLVWRQPEFSFGAFDEIEADLEAGGRRLTFSRLLVRLGGTSAVLRGSLMATGTLPLSRLERAQIALDLQGQIAAGRILDLRPFLPANLELRGAFHAEGQIAGTAAALQGALEVHLATPDVYGESWQSGEAQLRVLPAGIEAPRFVLRRGSEQVSGAIRIGSDGTLTGNLEGTNLDLSRLELTARAGVVGRATATLTLQGTVAEPRAVGPIACQALTIAEVPLGSVNGTVTLSRAGTDLTLSLQREAVRAHLVVGPFGRRNPRLDLTLQDAELDPLLRATSLDIPPSWQPRASGKVEVRSLSDTFAASDGQAIFSALRVQIGGEAWSGVGPAELSWREGTVNIRPVRLQSGERELTIQGTVGEGGQAALDMSGRMPIAALPANLPGFQPLGGTARGTIRLAGMLSAPTITGRLELAEGRFRLGQSPAPLEGVQAQVDLALGRVALKDVRGRWAGGAVAGNGEVTLGDGRWAVRASVQVENSRLEQLGSGSAQQTTGALTASGTFTSRGRVEQDFWENLAGSIQVTARDGGMGRQDFIVRVLSLANLGKLFNIRDLDLSAPSIPYRQLTADFTIERGIARTENCLLEARAFNASAVGKIDLASQYVEMEVAIKPFQTLNLLAEVPLAGWLLTGKERSLYSAFYDVSGPLANPNVRSLPVKDIDQNVFGIFKRVLRLPALLQGSAPE